MVPPFSSANQVPFVRKMRDSDTHITPDTILSNLVPLFDSLFLHDEMTCKKPCINPEHRPCCVVLTTEHKSPVRLEWTTLAVISNLDLSHLNDLAKLFCNERISKWMSEPGLMINRPYLTRCISISLLQKIQSMRDNKQCGRCMLVCS